MLLICKGINLEKCTLLFILKLLNKMNVSELYILWIKFKK